MIVILECKKIVFVFSRRKVLFPAPFSWRESWIDVSPSAPLFRLRKFFFFLRRISLLGKHLRRMSFFHSWPGRGGVFLSRYSFPSLVLEGFKHFLFFRPAF